MTPVAADRDFFTTPRRRAARPLATVALLAAVLAAGCDGPPLDDTYGRRRGRGAHSVAGTAALASMFRQNGCTVNSWGRISPKLEQYDVVVWFPDDFQTPNLEQRAGLERWLAAGMGRTLVYVGRDFNAMTTYWRRVLPATPANQWQGAAQRLARAQSDFEMRRAAIPEQEYARWFTLEGRQPPRRVTRLQSSEGWADGVDASLVDLRVEAQLRAAKKEDLPPMSGATLGGLPMRPQPWMSEQQQEPYRILNDRQIPQSQVLLDSDAGPLVRRVTDPRRWGGSQVLVVANGGFLLNLPLVNREHRKLAQRLVEACGENQEVVFLESGPGGPPVFRDEPEEGPPTGLELFTVWPIGLMMIHLLALGVLSCFVLFPSFGRARELPAPSPSDFGQHIEAVGELLARTGGADYVTSRLRHYHQVIKRDSGVSHASPPSKSEPPA